MEPHAAELPRVHIEEAVDRWELEIDGSLPHMKWKSPYNPEVRTAILSGACEGSSLYQVGYSASGHVDGRGVGDGG